MLMVKLSKAVNTVVKSFAKDAAGKLLKDKEGNNIVAKDEATGKELQRTIEITGLEFRQYESLAEAVQAAGSEDKVKEYINSCALADGKTRVRNVGLAHEASEADEVVITAARELASTFNCFTDKRKGEGITALANKYKELLAAKASGASDEDILALIKGGAI